MARPGRNPRTRFRRLTLAADASAVATGEPAPTITLDNRDSGGNIETVGLDELNKVFEALGFDVVFTYTAPAA